MLSQNPIVETKLYFEFVAGSSLKKISHFHRMSIISKHLLIMVDGLSVGSLDEKKNN